MIYTGFLAHLSTPGLKIAKSYLLSSSAVKPLNIIRRIKQLISICRGQHEESTESSMCDMYNTELRLVLDSTEILTTVRFIQMQIAYIMWGKFIAPYCLQNISSYLTKWWCEIICKRHCDSGWCWKIGRYTSWSWDWRWI